MGEVVSNLRSFPKPVGQASDRGERLEARILRAGYVAEIIRDAISERPLFHWIVQAVETGEVLALGQSLSQAEAERSAVHFLDDLRMRRAI